MAKSLPELYPTPMGTPARSYGQRIGDSGGTTMAHGATEYAVVTSCPLPSLAAALVAQ